MTPETHSSLNNDKWSRSTWLEGLTTLLLSAMSSQWDIGDFALRTPAEATRDEVRELLQEAADQTGYEVNSIRDLRTVAERIPPSLRQKGLSWYAHKEISKLFVAQEGKVNEEKSLALRSEFIDRFGAGAKVLDIRSAVREQLGKKDGGTAEMQTVSFKLTTGEYANLKDIVAAHPIHESIPSFVQELVRNFLLGSDAELTK